MHVKILQKNDYMYVLKVWPKNLGLFIHVSIRNVKTLKDKMPVSFDQNCLQLTF